MKKLFLCVLLLCITIMLCADYAQQCLLVNSFDRIKVIKQYSDHIDTDCGWFDALSVQYQISYLFEMFDFSEDGKIGYCYYIQYQDTTISVLGLEAVFESEKQVFFAEPDYALELCTQWSLDRIGVTELWTHPEFPYYGNGILVGVVDTGIDLGLGFVPPVNNIHEDLADNIYTNAGHHGINGVNIVSPSVRLAVWCC